MEIWEKIISALGLSLEPGRIEVRLSVFPPEFWVVWDSVTVSDSSERELSELAMEGTPEGLQALIVRRMNMIARTSLVEEIL